MVTINYRSIEVILGDYDYSCDMWSVGCIFFELLTRTVLFNKTDKNQNYNEMEHINSIFK